MKKLLALVSSVLLVGGTSMSVVACGNNTESILTDSEHDILFIDKINTEFKDKIDKHKFSEQSIEIDGEIDFEAILKDIKNIIINFKKEIASEFIKEENINFSDLNLNLNLNIIEKIETIWDLLNLVNLLKMELTLPINITYNINNELITRNYFISKDLIIKLKSKTEEKNLQLKK